MATSSCFCFTTNLCCGTTTLVERRREGVGDEGGRGRGGGGVETGRVHFDNDTDIQYLVWKIFLSVSLANNFLRRTQQSYYHMQTLSPLPSNSLQLSTHWRRHFFTSSMCRTEDKCEARVKTATHTHTHRLRQSQRNSV